MTGMYGTRAVAGSCRAGRSSYVIAEETSMADFEDSVGHIPSWTSGLAGWFVVLATLGGVGFGVATQLEPGTTTTTEGGPAAQAAKDDFDGSVWSLAFAPGDAYLASATIAGDVWIKDLATGLSRRLVDGPLCSLKSVAFSPDGRTLAVVGGEAAGRQWEIDTGTELEPLPVGGPAATKSIAFSPDGSLMAVGASGSGLALQAFTLVDRAHGRSYVLDGQLVDVRVMAFSPDGRTLAAGDSAGLVMLWDVATLRARATLRLNNSGPQSLVFSPDSSRLATLVYFGRDIQFWDTSTGESRGEITVENSVVFAFAPEGKTMAVAGVDGITTLWDVGEGRKLGSFGGRGRALYAIAFSNDGRRIATGGAEGHVSLWDVSEIHVANSQHGR
jgi:WD40 repeat protein